MVRWGVGLLICERYPQRVVNEGTHCSICLLPPLRVNAWVAALGNTRYKCSDQ